MWVWPEVDRKIISQNKKKKEILKMKRSERIGLTAQK